MKTADLLLNCFPVELSPTAFELPFADYKTWEASTEGLTERYAEFSAYRYEVKAQQIRVVLLHGPEVPDELQLTVVDVRDHPYLGTKLIERSISRYLYKRGLVVRWEDFGTTARPRAPELSRGVVDVFSGISFQVRRPFQTEPHNFIISVQWRVQAIFSQSLTNQTLREMAKGKPVLYRPLTHKAPKDLLRFRNKYLGHVHDILSNNEARVYCKDDRLRQIQAEELFFEASPSVIREYERRLGIKYESESVLSKMQELSFVLTPQGKRNPSVFKDRLQEIRHFLAGNSKEQLVIPLCCFRDGLISLGLSPVRVEIGQGV